ncbi:protein translocase subunit SecD [Candidatus Pandoraea novymonadis]|uniref:Protein translocase subunit SecD n=1 Tax=Candidatus Pandoraea novymonadis TaxID=1808959 RepID=A0ABX5FDP5_9BURK|nr:protein translocase subunit SecD [Candidatus Pandoraea novymonadis]PSB91863.1 hypothetical protein BZL35_00080 [Candidatus Pandoraea novymonadis]
MNRYPFWKYITILLALAIGMLYTLPNLFGETPAVQISSVKSIMQVDSALLTHIEDTLKTHNIAYQGTIFNRVGNNFTLHVRFADTDTQLHAKDLLETTLNTDITEPNYIVALNLLSSSPKWMTKIHALPMYLGLDLRGGVHYLLQVDIDNAINKHLDTSASDARALLREKNVKHNGLTRKTSGIEVILASQDEANRAHRVLTNNLSDLQYTVSLDKNAKFKVTGKLTENIRKTLQDTVVKQNIITLHNRVNELGVAEPLIQQEGSDRIVVQLPGIQDTAKAKDIIGRTATLEARLTDLDASSLLNLSIPPPPQYEIFSHNNGTPILLKREVIFSGERIASASVGFDEHQQPCINIKLDSAGGRVLRDISRYNIGKPMAIVLFEKGKGEVLTVANIRSELGENFQITGIGSAQDANDLALLLRAGSLAAPMEIIEERTIGPSLGSNNIKKGFDSVMYGLIAISIFMSAYYMLFGVFSVIALLFNLLLLVSVLSMLQATLTLPGMAAIALTLGMAIDANVLINERIREELRAGASPQKAITLGFEHAWSTILDSNVTTLIAGLALLTFGKGPVRAFAVVHCLGILTSIFSTVFFSRGLVNLWYGSRRKLKTLSIGQVWKPQDINAAEQ